MDTLIKKSSKVMPTVTEHWKTKFEKSIRVLLRSGYQLDQLNELLKEIVTSEHEKSN